MNVALSHCMDVYYLSFINQLLVFYRPLCLTFVHIWAVLFSIRMKHPPSCLRCLPCLPSCACSLSIIRSIWWIFPYFPFVYAHFPDLLNWSTIRTRTFSMTKNRSSFSCAESIIEHGLLTAYHFIHFNTLSLANANKSRKAWNFYDKKLRIRQVWGSYTIRTAINIVSEQLRRNQIYIFTCFFLL